MSKPGRKPRVSDEEILRVFQRSNDPVLMTSELADQVSIGRRTLHDRLKNLESDGRIQSKKVGAKGRVWWLSDGGDSTSLLSGGDFSNFIGAGIGMTVDDLYEMRREAAEGDEERWERLQSIAGDE